MSLSISNSKKQKTRDHCFIFTVCSLVLGFSILNGLSFMFIESTFVDSRKLEEQFWAQKVFASGNNADTIILGDSRAYRGIVPEEILKYCPDRNVLNFGFSSGGLNQEMFKFIDEKKRSPHGKGVFIIGITPFSLTTEARRNEHFLSILRLPREKIDEQLNYSPDRFSSAIFVKPMDRNRWKAIRRTLFKKAKKVKYDDRFHSNGWCESLTPSDPQEIKRTIESYIAQFKGNKVDLRSENELMEWIRKWTQEGHLVIGLRMPVNPELLSIENKQSGFDEIRVKNQFQASGGIYLEVEQVENFSCYDGSHLDIASARKLSERIGRAIASKLKD